MDASLAANWGGWLAAAAVIIAQIIASNYALRAANQRAVFEKSEKVREKKLSRLEQLSRDIDSAILATGNLISSHAVQEVLETQLHKQSGGVREGTAHKGNHGVWQRFEDEQAKIEHERRVLTKHLVSGRSIVVMFFPDAPGLNSIYGIVLDAWDHALPRKEERGTTKPKTGLSDLMKGLTSLQQQLGEVVQEYMPEEARSDRSTWSSRFWPFC